MFRFHPGFVETTLSLIFEQLLHKLELFLFVVSFQFFFPVFQGQSHSTNVVFKCNSNNLTKLHIHLLIEKSSLFL